KAGFLKFEAVVTHEGLGSIIPNQCEVSYINQIELPSGQSAFEAFRKLFGSFTGALVLNDLGKPEDARFLLQHVIRDNTGAPLGRLYTSALPARKFDGTNIIQLT